MFISSISTEQFISRAIRMGFKLSTINDVKNACIHFSSTGIRINECKYKGNDIVNYDSVLKKLNLIM